jgi:hypothetical protein
MAAPVVFRIPQGSTLRKITMILKSGVGTDAISIDLTGCTVVFRMRHMVSGATTIADDPTSGEVSYSWAADDTAVAGDYEAEVEVTYPSEDVFVLPASDFFIVKVRDSLVSAS